MAYEVSVGAGRPAAVGCLGRWCPRSGGARRNLTDFAAPCVGPPLFRLSPLGRLRTGGRAAPRSGASRTEGRLFTVHRPEQFRPDDYGGAVSAFVARKIGSPGATFLNNTGPRLRSGGLASRISIVVGCQAFYVGRVFECIVYRFCWFLVFNAGGRFLCFSKSAGSQSLPGCFFPSRRGLAHCFRNQCEHCVSRIGPSIRRRGLFKDLRIQPMGFQNLGDWGVFFLQNWEVRERWLAADDPIGAAVKKLASRTKCGSVPFRMYSAASGRSLRYCVSADMPYSSRDGSDTATTLAVSWRDGTRPKDFRSCSLALKTASRRARSNVFAITRLPARGCPYAKLGCREPVPCGAFVPVAAFALGAHFGFFRRVQAAGVAIGSRSARTSTRKICWYEGSLWTASPPPLWKVGDGGRGRPVPDTVPTMEAHCQSLRAQTWAPDEESQGYFRSGHGPLIKVGTSGGNYRPNTG